MLFFHFLEYGYHFPIEPFIFYYGLILVEMCSFLFHVTKIWCLGDQKQYKIGFISINMNNYHNIYIHFVEYGYRCPIQPLIFSYVRILVEI